MSNSTDIPAPNRSSMVFLGLTVLTFLAASAAPTPLYRIYQENMHFSAATLTLIFGVYALSLLTALLTVGSLSDYLGRRPVIFCALILDMLAMGLFLSADSVAWLIAARLLQGFATGMATSALGAAMLDNDRQQGPLINSISPLVGMACGAFGTSVLVEFAPQPLHLAYWVLLGLLAAQAVYVWRLPESVSPQPGVLGSLRPSLHIPSQARAAMWQVLPVNVAVWAMGGFYLALVPSLIRAATGSNSFLVGGAMVAVLTLSGALAIFSMRNQSATRVLTLGSSLLVVGVSTIMLAVHSGNLGLFFFGSLVAGSGFGTGFLGSIRSVVPLALPHERAGLMSAFYILSYLAFCLPVLLVGSLTRIFGLVRTADGFSVVLIVLALGALLSVFLRRAASPCKA